VLPNVSEMIQGVWWWGESLTERQRRGKENAAAVCAGFKGCGQIEGTLRSLAGSSLQPNF